MRKLFALFHNELIKIFSKTATWILIIIMVVSQIGLGAILKLTGINDVPSFADSETSDYMKEQEEYIKTLKEDENKQQYVADGETDPVKKLEALNDLAQTKAEIYAYEFAAKNGMARNQLQMYSYDNYLMTCFDKLVELKSGEYLYDLASDLIKDTVNGNPLMKAGIGSIINLITGNKTRIAAYEEIIINKDYKKFIQMSNDEIYSDKSKTKDEKDIEVYCNNLRLKSDPTGSENNWKAEEMIQNIGKAKLSLLHNVNYVFDANQNVPLTEDEKIQIKNLLAVNTYTMEQGILSDYDQADNMDSLSIMSNIGMMFVIVLTMILAGGSISQEIATGSIKSLIISPVKRWKIFTAKLLSVIFTSFFATLILYISSMATALIFFGKGAMIPYVFAVNGVAKELNFFVYRFSLLMVGFIDVFAYTLFAMMLSTVTRNTAVSVAAPIGVYFSSSIILAFTKLISNDLIVKFFPLTNLGLEDKFFPFTDYAMLYGECLKHSLRFSLIYVCVMCLCMLVTALDSFNRRDLN